MGEIARSKSRIASDLKTRGSFPQTPQLQSDLRLETRDWRFVAQHSDTSNAKRAAI